MNKILLTVVAFFSSQEDKVKRKLSQLFQIDSYSCDFYQNKTRHKRTSLNKYFAFLLMFFLSVSFANATTYTSSQSGNWNSAATWGGVGVPGTGDVVVIMSHAITVTANATCTSLEFNGNTPSLSVNLGISLTVGNTTTGSIVVDSSNGSNRTVAISGLGTLSCFSLTVGNNAVPSSNATTILTSTISYFNIIENLGIVSRTITSPSTRTNNSTFNLESGILNVDGQITTTNQNSANTSTFSMATGVATGTLLLGNAAPFNLTPTGTSTIALNGTSSNVNYDGLAQAVRATTYTNLTLSGSGIKTISATTTVNNNLTVSGTAVLAPDATNRISDAAKLVFNGGSYSTGGFSETMGTLTLNDNSTIALGAANHTVNLASSNGATWVSGKILTITGWTGAFGSAGRRIFVGNSAAGLTAAQLAQIKFQNGAENRDAMILATGEVVPAFCPFASNVQSGTTQSICYNSNVSGANIGGITFSAVPVDSYIAVNVIEGVQYRIASTGTSKTFIKRLTLFNGSSTTTALATTNAASATSAATIDWTATFTGVLYVVFNSANCQTSAQTDNITVTYIGGNNIADSQTAFGADFWIGHVYNFSDTATVEPSDADAFGNYLGSFTQANTVSGSTTSFTQNYNTSVSTTTCFPFTAGGTSQSVYTETFVVRYKMRSTLPAGCYFVGVTGDDGVRLYVDGVLVFDAWTQQSATAYANVLVSLNGNSELIFDYYEKTGNNVSNFTIYPASSTINALNTIVTSGPIVRCVNTATTLDGSNISYQGGNANPSIKFQWQSSIDNSNWGDIIGATSEDYTVLGTNPASATKIYYRRNVTGSSANSSTCIYSTSSIAITTSPSTAPTVPILTAATSITCSSFIVNWNSVPTATSYKLDVSTNSGFSSFVAGYGGLDVGLVTSKNVVGLTNGTTYYYRLRAYNGCGPNTSGNSAYSSIITVSPVVPTASSQSFCGSSTVASLTGVAPSGSVVDWYSAASGGTALASGTVLSSTTYYGESRNTTTGCVSTTRTSVAVTINALPVVPTASSQSFCGSSTVASLTGTAPSGSVVDWYAAASGGTALASGTALSSTIYYGESRNTTTGCVSTTRTSVAVTMNSTPVVPIASATSQPTCVVSTGTITVTSPTGMNYSIDGVDYSNSDGIFSGLAVGSYTVMARNGSCVSLASAPISINAPITNTWNGIKWSKTNNAVPPTIDDIVVFNGNYGENVDIRGCSCQVNAGFTVTIPGGKTMTITNAVTNGGTLIFENNASLVQLDDDAVNTGSITYRRVSAPMKNFDFTYWSSPVKDQILNVLSPNTFWDKYYSYANNKWVTENGNNKMNDAGKGFIIRVPKPNSTYPNGKDSWTGTTYSQPVEFIGVPYNGVISVPVLAGQNNLIGNPYPSAVDAETFMEDNVSVIYGGLYFWTHNSAPTQTGTVYSYSSNDYTTFTLTGSTITVPGVDPPAGKIASGQSFFVGSKIAGNFVFNNGMRISDPGSNSQFFKIAKTKKTVTKEKNRVWLNLSNPGGAFKQLLVGYIDGATNEYDNLYDGVSFSGNSYVDFYSINNEKTLTIQGRALPFNKTDEVPLGYKATIDGAFDISIDKVDGTLTNQAVYIEDKVANVIYNLKNGPYSFTTLKGTFNDRFVLRYADKTTLGTDSFDTSGKSVIVSVKNHQIKINSFEETIAAVKVYDLKGSLIYENNKVSKDEFMIENLTASDQFLIVLTQLENGKWVTQEIIFQK
ncbi:PA14 domain-containing protein [Flavobacterium taihuense]|uniref:T9SS sorting signal type C domain-containing protein n=1 Tax=Flavobacterium taihuense TaxID=2857508 RepID=A0ABS6XWR2_9FLAO|nr:PA14 domain-containing protein [Flavobacterium taihuense]MBW4361109.1 hypothetical protein [Flavobacterium taihuense]